jgi:hypothetical protein
VRSKVEYDGRPIFKTSLHINCFWYVFFIHIIGLFFLTHIAFAGSEQLFGTWGSVFINGKVAKDSNWIYYMDASISSSQTHQNFNGGQGYVFAAAVTHDLIDHQLSLNLYINVPS